MRTRIWGMVAAFATSVALLSVGPAAASAAISGHVADPAGNPIEGIEACAEYRPVVPNPNVCARTDANGDYSIPSGVPGELVHFVSTQEATPAYASQWWPAVPFSEEAQPVAEADAGRVDATMVVGGIVAGRLVSRATSLPIEGVGVCPSPVVFRELESYFCARSDADGRFTLRGLSEAEYRIELRTDRDVNFLDTRLGPLAVRTGGEIELEASLVPGVEITGTVTDAATGRPAEALLAPAGSMPRICAVDSATEAPIKCTTFELDGTYSLPGIPPGLPFGVSFAVDVVEEGFDLGNDGFVRRYWDESPDWAGATFLTGTPGTVLEDVDAALTHGPEVFPNCEAKGSCPTPPESPAPPDPTPPAAAAPAAPGSPPSPVTSPATAPVRVPATHRCATGFRHLDGAPKTRCVKVYKGPRRKKHHPPAHPVRHRS